MALVGMCMVPNCCQRLSQPILRIESVCVIKGLPYTAKYLRGKTFAVFVVFHSIANVFP